MSYHYILKAAFFRGVWLATFASSQPSQQVSPNSRIGEASNVGQGSRPADRNRNMKKLDRVRVTASSSGISKKTAALLARSGLGDYNSTFLFSAHK